MNSQKNADLIDLGLTHRRKVDTESKLPGVEGVS